MPNLYITEFDRSGQDARGAEMQAARVPSLGTQKITFVGASVQSAVLNANTTMIRVHTDGTCHILFGTNPTATTSHLRLVQDQTEYFVVQPNSGLRIAVIQGA